MQKSLLPWVIVINRSPSRLLISKSQTDTCALRRIRNLYVHKPVRDVSDVPVLHMVSDLGDASVWVMQGSDRAVSTFSNSAASSLSMKLIENNQNISHELLGPLSWDKRDVRVDHFPLMASMLIPFGKYYKNMLQNLHNIFLQFASS